MTHHKFIGLDGLRGVAAIAVVIYHCTGETYHLAGAGYAAVDFFFALSGLVLAHSYDQRIESMGVAGFMRQRVVRLYPLYLVGSLAGLAVSLGLPGPIDAKASGVWVAVCAALLFLPAPGWHDPFPFNNPAWSLFWELVANSVYAFRSRTIRQVLTLSLVSGVVYLACVLVFRRSFGATADGFVIGLPRVLFSFFAGVTVYRLWRGGRLPRIRVPATALAAFLFAVLVVSYQPLNGAHYLAFTFVLSPLLLAVAVQNEPGERARPIFAWLGWTSYGVYVLHAPIRTIAEWALGGQGLGSTVLTLCAAFACAHVLTLYVDAPVRRAIQRSFSRRKSPNLAA